MTRVLFTLLVLLASPWPGYAQDQGPVRVGMRVGDPPAGAVDVVGYDSGGRRDPFVSLVLPRRPVAASATGAAAPRKSGLAGLALADAQIRGIVRHGDQMLAIAEGPDNRSYVLHVKDRLLDAEVKAIDAQGVIFVERVDAATGRAPREIRKPLRPAAGGGIR